MKGEGKGKKGKRRGEGMKEIKKKYKIRKNLYKNTKELEYFGKEYKGVNHLCTQLEVHD